MLRVVWLREDFISSYCEENCARASGGFIYAEVNLGPALRAAEARVTWRRRFGRSNNKAQGGVVPSTGEGIEKYSTMKAQAAALVLAASISVVSSLWCYQCVSSHPGCGLYDFDWRYYWSHYCHDANNKCVKLIEQKGVDVKVTRDCLSNLEGHRRDIPADRYEGCRPAAKDPLIGQYIFPSIPEIDHKREYYTNVTFCFCDFDERCNSASASVVSLFLSGCLVMVHLAVWG